MRSRARAASPSRWPAYWRRSRPSGVHSRSSRGSEPGARAARSRAPSASLMESRPTIAFRPPVCIHYSSTLISLAFPRVLHPWKISRPSPGTCRRSTAAVEIRIRGDFSADVSRTVARLGIHLQRTALQSPWQNGTAERFAGTVRRELLDHVVVLSEDRLRRLLREYVAYYNTERVHTSIGDAPEGRAVQEQPSKRAKVIGLPRVGGLHHRYAWTEA